ncbi:MAG: DUF4386 domain-containing protein [Flavisolibacter sp.]
MEERMFSIKKTARVAGLLYFLMIIAAVYSHIYVPSQLLVREDPAATSRNILDNEFLFRSCIVVNLAGAIIFLFLSLTLYRLFQQVNNQLASILVALVVVQIPVIFILNAFKLTSLMILKGDPGQLPDLSMLFLQMNGYGMMTLALFAGLWLFPFGLLVYKSRFIPRVFGILLMIAASGYNLDGLLGMLFPDYGQPQILPYIFFGIGEIPIMLWLLFQGVKDHLSIEIIAEVKTQAKPVKLFEV